MSNVNKTIIEAVKCMEVNDSEKIKPDIPGTKITKGNIDEILEDTRRGACDIVLADEVCKPKDATYKRSGDIVQIEGSFSNSSEAPNKNKVVATVGIELFIRSIKMVKYRSRVTNTFKTYTDYDEQQYEDKQKRLV